MKHESVVEPMSKHDPFCYTADRWDAGLSVGDVSGPCPGCNLIARARTDEREQISADIEAQMPFTTHSDDCECADCTARNVMLSCVRIVRGGTDE